MVYAIKLLATVVNMPLHCVFMFVAENLTVIYCGLIHGTATFSIMTQPKELLCDTQHKWQSAYMTLRTTSVIMLRVTLHFLLYYFDLSLILSNQAGTYYRTSAKGWAPSLAANF